MQLVGFVRTTLECRRPFWRVQRFVVNRASNSLIPGRVIELSSVQRKPTNDCVTRKKIIKWNLGILLKSHQEPGFLTLLLLPAQHVLCKIIILQWLFMRAWDLPRRRRSIECTGPVYTTLSIHNITYTRNPIFVQNPHWNFH